MPIANDYINKPYILHFATWLLLREEISDKLPDWCKYPMPAAQSVTHYQFGKTDVLTQQFNQAPFYVDVLQIHTKQPFQFKFQVRENQLFLLFMLHGAFEFSTVDGQYITKARTNYFYLSHNGPGIFKARMDKGDHVAFVVSIEIDWAKRVCNELPNLNNLIQRIFDTPSLFNIMPRCRIDKQVRLWLKEVHSLSKNNIGILDGMLRMYMSLALEHYNKLLTGREGLLAYKVKKYLDDHYADPDIGYHSLSEVFYVTKRTLRNQFKQEFDVTIYDYYSGLRLQKAQYLIENKKEAAKDVYIKVGYRDESSFRHAYNKYTGKSPR